MNSGGDPRGLVEAQIKLRGASKHYGSVVGVNTVDLTVGKGEFFSLLGPSGCGKSTILKLIAGFEDPTAGEVIVAGRSMAGVPPEHRNIGFVFQNYALFPNMTVFENVAFGLRARGVPESTLRDRVQEILRLVELPDVEHRRPSQLSGGQQQRIALARALVIQPDVLLLDEPLGALDRKLRQAMQTKLVELQRRLGVTTIFVTHDQEEALTMSDRVAVMSVRRHAIEQVAAPREIYERPASILVSSFIGQVNLWEEEIREASEDGHVTTARGFRIVTQMPLRPQQVVIVSLRPERIQIVPASAAADSRVNRLPGRVRDVIFSGETITYLIETSLGVPMQVKELNSDSRALCGRGQDVCLAWLPEAMLPLPGRGDHWEDQT